MFIEIDMARLEKCIFGESTKTFSTADYLRWKMKVKEELEKMKKGLNYDERTINNLYNYLNRVDFVDNRKFTLYGGKTITIKELETIYKYIHRDTDYTKKIEMEDLLSLYEDISKNYIVVTVFETEKQAMEYVFVGGNDNEEILDNIEFLIKMAEDKVDYNWKKANNVLEIDGRYFVLQW